MMSINTNNINFELNNSKFSKLEDSKLDAYILKKQLELTITNSYKVESNNYVPNMKLKAQVEELQKLQSEIDYMEKRVRELEHSKRVKLIKVKLYNFRLMI
jgi:hypothetical protein